MSGEAYYIIGILVGIAIGYFLFKFLTKRNNKKLSDALDKGLSEKGYDFIKYDNTQKEVKDEENRPKFDREAILEELLGRRRTDSIGKHKDAQSSERERKIDAIKSEVIGREPEIEGKPFYDRVTRDVQERDIVSPDTDKQSQPNPRRIVKLK